MNKKLLIAGFLVLFFISCSSLTETTSYDYKNHSISVISDSISDDEFMAILEPYRDLVESKMSEVIATTSESMLSYRPESPLSNFLSDMILEFAKDYCISNKLDVIPDIALFNHGGIRSSLPKGEIKIQNAYEIMPFENEIVLVLLSGEQVIDLANYIATRGGEGVAGISFGITQNRAEDIKIHGLRVDVNKNYWLVSSDYIVNGGDGMKVLTWAEKRIDTGELMRDVIISYLKMKNAKGEILQASTDGRIYHVE
ncbi:MAG: 5'-nucleotidase [Prolixibacteraceae bacterium]|jgi:2',3'-cyclic-nucleotide 2'-phosphodiesterase (5'-nucleotidase family)|nr:5'-nucleotidase [Prolixibacteraceae bacterium]